jgi:hypothetical protein
MKMIMDLEHQQKIIIFITKEGDVCNVYWWQRQKQRRETI